MATQINEGLSLLMGTPTCVHALTGLAPRAKMCAFQHECLRCEFDQMVEDVAPVHGNKRERAVNVARAA